MKRKVDKNLSKNSTRPSHNKKGVKKENLLWVVGSLIVYISFLVLGANLINSTVPQYRIFDYETIDSIGANWKMDCGFYIQQGRDYILKGDLLYCYNIFYSTKYENITASITAELIDPNRQATLLTTHGANNYVLLESGENYGFLVPINQTGLHKIVLTLNTETPEYDYHFLTATFDVYSGNEILQMNINRNLVFVMLLTGLFAVFPAFYYIRKMLEGEEVR